MRENDMIAAAVREAAESMQSSRISFPDCDVTLIPRRRRPGMEGVRPGAVIMDEIQHMPIEHLCIDGTIKDGTREKCCLAQWKEAGA